MPIPITRATMSGTGIPGAATIITMRATGTIMCAAIMWRPGTGIIS